MAPSGVNDSDEPSSKLRRSVSWSITSVRSVRLATSASPEDFHVPAWSPWLTEFVAWAVAVPLPHERDAVRGVVVVGPGAAVVAVVPLAAGAAVVAVAATVVVVAAGAAVVVVSSG